MALVESLAARSKRSETRPIGSLQEAREELERPDPDGPEVQDEVAVGDREWNKNIPWWMKAAAFAPEVLGAATILSAVGIHVIQGFGQSFRTGQDLPRVGGNMYVFDAQKKLIGLRPGPRRLRFFGSGFGRSTSWTYYPGEPN